MNVLLLCLRGCLLASPLSLELPKAHKEAVSPNALSQLSSSIYRTLGSFPFSLLVPFVLPMPHFLQQVHCSFGRWGSLKGPVFPLLYHMLDSSALRYLVSLSHWLPVTTWQVPGLSILCNPSIVVDHLDYCYELRHLLTFKFFQPLKFFADVWCQLVDKG